MRIPSNAPLSRHPRMCAAVAGAALTLLLAGCSMPGSSPAGSGSPATSVPGGSSASATPSRPPVSTPTATPSDDADGSGSDDATDPIAKLTLEQRVGQLFMVGTKALAPQSGTIAAIRNRHVGNVFLSGRSSRGVAATAKVTEQLRNQVTAKSTGNVPLFVATDQEGGLVQVLSGPGFSQMPTALTQGAESASALRADATTWGKQLAAAGVTMNLAPVVDLIPSAVNAAQNAPIGAFQREYGFTRAGIVSSAGAVRAGMSAAGVETVIKHFPGLGAVRGNTDVTANVTDKHTTDHGPSVGIYADEIADGARCVMVSSAIYSRIDPGTPAVFSRPIVTDLLRDKLGFTGVVVTDDISGAVQVQAWSPARRAILAISAGVDIVLVTRTPADAAPMVDAVVAKAKSDPAFAALVDAAARRVLALKASE